MIRFSIDVILLKMYRCCLFDYEFFNSYKRPLAARSLAMGQPMARIKPFSVLDKLIYCKLKFNYLAMKFTEKSLTQPGMAFSAKAIIKRSQNGTLPAIYQNGSYELSEDSKGYEHQEHDDSFVDDYPQVEDVAAYKEQSRDFESEFRSSVAEFVKRSREKVSDVGTSNLQRDFDEGEVDVPAARTATPRSEAKRNARGVRRAAENVPQDE